MALCVTYLRIVIQYLKLVFQLVASFKDSNGIIKEPLIINKIQFNSE